MAKKKEGGKMVKCLGPRQGEHWFWCQEPCPGRRMCYKCQRAVAKIRVGKLEEGRIVRDLSARNSAD